MLAQVWIEHKGHRVKVGSGWSQDNVYNIWMVQL